MPYSTNPNLPKVRMEAVRLVRSGWSTVKVAKHLGYAQGTISKWVQRAPDNPRKKIIPTQSSRPEHHPHELAPEIVRRILDLRREWKTGAVHLHWLLQKEGIPVSLSSVKRTLSRNNTTKFSKWKKWHVYPPRPLPEAPGILVEADTVHFVLPERLYVYTLLDVHSRWAHAIPSERISTWRSLHFVEAARDAAPFSFRTVQTDHGSEFSKWFTKRLDERGIAHRHSRIRTPNDNAHLERWNRTIQEECLSRIPHKLKLWQKEIPEFLRYYNEERPHQGLGMLTPMQKLAETIPSY